MLGFMERSTIYLLKQKGWSNAQIAEVIGCHRDSVARVLREPPDKQPAQRERTSQVAVFHDQIQTWLDQNLSVRRMIELARQDADHPYQGIDPAFYAYVRPLRRRPSKSSWEPNMSRGSSPNPPSGDHQHRIPQTC